MLEVPQDLEHWESPHQTASDGKIPGAQKAARNPAQGCSNMASALLLSAFCVQAAAEMGRKGAQALANSIQGKREAGQDPLPLKAAVLSCPLHCQTSLVTSWWPVQPVSSCAAPAVGLWRSTPCLTQHITVPDTKKQQKGDGRAIGSLK